MNQIHHPQSPGPSLDESFDYMNYQTPMNNPWPTTPPTSNETSPSFGSPVPAYYPMQPQVETYTSFVQPVDVMLPQNFHPTTTFVPPVGFVSVANFYDNYYESSWANQLEESRIDLSRLELSPPSPTFSHTNQQSMVNDLIKAAGVTAVVEEGGYISLQLDHDVVVDIAPNQAIMLKNPRQQSVLAISGCGTQMAMIHPQGRILQYNTRIEVQAQRARMIKNAKIWPRGISFTSNQSALVYLVDQAGVRSTTDTFHNLYSDDIAQAVFDRSYTQYPEVGEIRVERSIRDLERAVYWQTTSHTNCWIINNVCIKQTNDGLVCVERKHGTEHFLLRSSPNNGKSKAQSSFLYMTASSGQEAHLFVKSKERRIHYNGEVFVVRNAGHSAGFDAAGQLKIW